MEKELINMLETYIKGVDLYMSNIKTSEISYSDSRNFVALNAVNMTINLTNDMRDELMALTAVKENK